MCETFVAMHLSILAQLAGAFQPDEKLRAAALQHGTPPTVIQEETTRSLLCVSYSLSRIESAERLVAVGKTVDTQSKGE